MLRLQNSAEPGTMSQVGDADAGLRERVAGEDRLTAVSHSRAGALSHLPVQEVGGEGGDSSQPAGPTGPRAPGFTVSSQGSATGPCNPASCDRCCPPHQRPFLLFNQTLQTSTHTGPGSGKMTVSSGVHILPRNGAVSPFSSTWGNAHQPLHRGTPLRSALVPLLWTLLGTGLCLWRGVWKEVEGESFFRPSLVGPKDHCQLFVFQTPQFFLAAPCWLWKFSRCFLLSTLLALVREEREEGRDTETERQSGRHPKTHSDLVYLSQPWAQGQT